MTSGADPRPQSDPKGITSFFQQPPPHDVDPIWKGPVDTWDGRELQLGIGRILSHNLIPMDSEQQDEWKGA